MPHRVPHVLRQVLLRHLLPPLHLLLNLQALHHPHNVQPAVLRASFLLQRLGPPHLHLHLHHLPLVAQVWTSHRQRRSNPWMAPLLRVLRVHLVRPCARQLHLHQGGVVRPHWGVLLEQQPAVERALRERQPPGKLPSFLAILALDPAVGSPGGSPRALHLALHRALRGVLHLALAHVLHLVLPTMAIDADLPMVLRRVKLLGSLPPSLALRCFVA